MFDACGMVSGRFMNELDNVYQCAARANDAKGGAVGQALTRVLVVRCRHADTVESHLATTAENGRLLSLLLKLGLVNERPEVR